MGHKGNEPFWRKASAIFQERAAEYDQWFDESLVFQIELAALQALETPVTFPGLEVGVGPGRFAGELGVSYGIDPAMAPLQIAKKHGIHGCAAVGEALPIRNGCFDTVYILFALCFMADPLKALVEAKRVLTKGGHVVVGIINASSAWGRMLQAKKEAQHPFYQYATFYKPDMVLGWFDELGITLKEARSCLLEAPEQLKSFENSTKGIDPRAGCIILVGQTDD